MKLIATVFVAATCAIQSTLAASMRHGRVDMMPDIEPPKNIAKESSAFLETIREILFGDLQAPTENHRSLQDGPNCGAVDFPCTHGAVCKADETKDGADWCFCDVPNGYMNDPGPDIPIVALYGLQGYRSCVQADECSQMTNVCALGDEGGGCEDRDPENGKYMCFCKEGYLADLSSIGEHGPEACDQVNECLIFKNICGDGKICIDTPGSFQCQCEDDMIETQNGGCLDPPVAETLESCDPLSGDDCVEPERECDEELKKCICIPGWIQPAGAGGQCRRALEVDECVAQTDVACDRRGRGGPDPRSKCINSKPISYESSLNLNGNPRQGYTCECLPPYYDAPNAIRGTNCLEPDPTPAPVSAIIATPVPEPASTAPTPPSPALPCTTFVCTAPFSFCAAEQNRCVCQSGYIQSLGSPFSCEETCLVDTDCLTDEHCFESRCTPCPPGAFREVNATDGCVDPCVSNTTGVPDPCPALCESFNSTEFICLCNGTDLHCLQDDTCNTTTGTCEDCPLDEFREVDSVGGCVAGSACGAFTSIASIGDELSISNQYDGAETVNLNHPFPWRGFSRFRSISVSSNGLIWLGADVTGCGCDGKPIGENSEVPRIAVANADLDPSFTGSIYVLLNPAVTIVSWEGVTHVETNAEFDLNVQALLHEDGRVEIRFGDGNPKSGRSHISGLDDQKGLAVPATGNPFDEVGRTSEGEWPTDVCCLFTPGGGASYGAECA